MSSRDRGVVVSLFIGLLGCATAVQSVGGDIDATLSRGGGIAGLSETVHVWSISGESHGLYARSDRPGSRELQLQKSTLDSSLAVLGSLISHVPQIPPDTRAVRHVCADMILLRIDVRRDGRAESAEEECPHRTTESEKYWQRVDSLFQFFAAAAR
jgi:hypothetical protein